VSDRSRIALARIATIGPPLVLVTSALVGVIVAAQVRSVVIQGSSQTIAAGASGLAAPCLSVVEGRSTLTEAGCDDLARAVGQRLETGQVYAYRLIGLDGVVLYSSTADDTGRRVAVDGFDSAADGRVTSSVESADEAGVDADGRVLRVVAPVRKGDVGPVIAVAESIKPFAPIAASVRESVLIVWLAVGSGAVFTSVATGLIARRAVRAIDTQRGLADSLNQRLRDSLADIESQSLGVLQALSATVDARDQYTARHSLGTTEVAFRIGGALGLSPHDQTVLERAALLHDIGKIGVPEALLLKPSALSPEDYERVKEHSEAGARILETVPFLADVVPIVRHHHERWDGSGYPAGLAGEDIPFLARVLAVADSFDAMVSERPYRGPLPRRLAIDEVVLCSGSQFDPAVVDAFVAWAETTDN
jgi:putative nucleotidyltransferase with HDIG domain